jgi:hypothetical protein
MSPFFCLLWCSLAQPSLADTVVTSRYLRPAGAKLVLESEVTEKRSATGVVYVSLTDRGAEKMTLTLRFDKDRKLQSAEALQVTKDGKKSATLTVRGNAAELVRADGGKESFKLMGEPVVTTAPDWSDIFQVIQRYDHKKMGKQEFPGLWIHPTKPARQLSFVVEPLGKDEIVMGMKKVTLTRFRVTLRSGAYLVWADDGGQVIRLCPATRPAALVVLDGFADATRDLR